mmetsp:Transcript_51207/g.165897  ORF Transcript_51207/g.165897 Transcript_51207/m.165897 type:complete len:213 (-) Transcript_51207:63-701(-)
MCSPRLLRPLGARTASASSRGAMRPEERASNAKTLRPIIAATTRTLWKLAPRVVIFASRMLLHRLAATSSSCPLAPSTRAWAGAHRPTSPAIAGRLAGSARNPSRTITRMQSSSPRRKSRWVRAPTRSPRKVQQPPARLLWPHCRCWRCLHCSAQPSFEHRTCIAKADASRGAELHEPVISECNRAARNSCIHTIGFCCAVGFARGSDTLCE